MTVATITPAEARRLIDPGAVLIDVREADEHAREHIPGAVNRPLSALGPRLDAGGARAVIFHCKSGGRTATSATRLAEAAAGCDAYVVAGGLDAWKGAGLPTVADRRQPIEIMRQVQIAAGALILLGGALGWLVDPAFFALSIGVGAGLTFAGLTGTCAMATLLRRMPWNRAPQGAA